MIDDVKLIELENGSKWIPFATVNYKNDTYKYLLGVNEEEDDLSDDTEIVKEYVLNNKKFIQTIDDPNLLRILIPLLVPETLEYIQNPQKIKELF